MEPALREPQVECDNHLKIITLKCASDVFMVSIFPKFLRIGSS